MRYSSLPSAPADAFRATLKVGGNDVSLGNGSALMSSYFGPMRADNAFDLSIDDANKSGHSSLSLFLRPGWQPGSIHNLGMGE